MSMTAPSVKLLKWETAVYENGLIRIGRRKGSQEIKHHKRRYFFKSEECTCCMDLSSYLCV